MQRMACSVTAFHVRTVPSRPPVMYTRSSGAYTKPLIMSVWRSAWVDQKCASDHSEVARARARSPGATAIGIALQGDFPPAHRLGDVIDASGEAKQRILVLLAT